MKIIPPYKISSEILALIHEAKEYLILVSPYVDFANWQAMKTAIQNAMSRNVKIKFYVRLEDKNFKSWEQVEALGIIPKLVKNLHTKLYFNEKSGIVTSMNLLTSSNLNAIEFASIYNLPEEVEELKSYVKNYLEPNIEKEKPNDEDLYLAKERFHIILQNFLSNELDKRVSCKWQNGVLQINTGSTYYVSLDKVRNRFSISGIVSGLESDHFETFRKESKLSSLQLTCFNDEGSIGSFEASLNKSYTSNNFDFLSVNEKKEIIDYVFGFIFELTGFKEYCYENRKVLNAQND